jgi:hypothetical protein
MDEVAFWLRSAQDCYGGYLRVPHEGAHGVSSGMIRAHTATPNTSVRIKNEEAPREIGYHR